MPGVVTLNLEGLKNDRVRIESNGVVVTSTFTRDAAARSAATRLGVPAEVIDAAVAAFRRDGTSTATWTPPEDADDQTPEDVFRVRLIHQPAANATEYDDFDAALGHPGATKEHVIEWKDAGLVAALDFDWHTSKPPEDVGRFIHLATPRPSYGWVTRSGGLRLIYVRQGDTPADAIAAVAAYGLYQRMQPEALELKTGTRFPSGDIERLPGSVDLSSIRSMFDDTSFDTVARDEYLAERGLTIGSRHAHDVCPMNPGRRSNSPDPVLICDDGVRCFSCGGRGRGFVSWGQLIGHYVPTEFAVCVRNFTHWEHARYVVAQHINLPDGLLESFYRAALVVSHGADDPRIPSVFRERDLVRFDGFWGTRQAEIRRDDRVKYTVAGLPVCLGPDGKIDNEKHERFLDSSSLDRWGYFPLKRVYGISMTRFMSPLPDCRPRIEVDTPGIIKPRYLEPDARDTEDAAWGLIESAYPGVDRALIELLVFCRGRIEFGHDNPPMFLFEGASGSGKTGSPHLAAAICGEVCTNIVPQEREERLWSQILNAMHSHGTFISVSEVVKSARKYRVQPRDYLNFMLQLTPQQVAHVLYKGPVKFGDVPILCVSDTEFTEEILADTQLGRRLFYRDLGQEFRDWKSGTAAAGLLSWTAIRSVESFRRAADSLLSIWIDRYWQAPPAFTVDEVAASLGIGYMKDREANSDRAELMASLFHAWLAYEGAGGAYAKREARGFKAFRVDPDKFDIAAIWVQLHDENSPTTWSRANERSWQQVTGHPRPLRLVVRRMFDDRDSWVQLSFQERDGDKWKPVAVSPDQVPF